MATAKYSNCDELRKQREYRKRTGNRVTKKYERTKKGKLMRTYRNMQSRVEGILKGKCHLYEGKAICTREEFYEWALSTTEFHWLYDRWVNRGHKPGDSPSIDRIDPDKGYTLGNMRWLTHADNSSRIRRKPSHAEPLPLPDAA